MARGKVERGARLYIGGEGRPRSTVTREGGRDPMTVVPVPVPAIGAGRAGVVFACWDSSPTRARGPSRARHGHGAGRVVSFVGRV
jgi:hypothetical protein